MEGQNRNQQKEETQKTAGLKAAPKEPAGVKTGLVLEGGGMRGIYTAGVLDVFLEHGISFDGVIGVSAGAIHGCSFVSGQIGRSIRYYKKYCNDKRFMSFQNMIRTGDMVDEQFCYHQLPETLDPYDYDAFNRSNVAYYVTCTNLVTGRPEYLQITDMKKQIDLMRASASLPYVSRIVEYEGKKLLDGGCSDSIPVHAFMKMGYEKNVVVLTRHREYKKQPENAHMARVYYRKYPRFAAAMKKRHVVYNNSRKLLKRLEEAGKAFVICPSRELVVSRTCHDVEVLQRAYDLGRQDAVRQLGNLEVFLENRG